MRGFLYKDFILARTILIIIAVLAAFCSLGFFLSAGIEGGPTTRNLLIFFAFFAGGMLNMGFFGFDEKPVWFSFAASCPPSYRGQAASKYALILLINIGLLLVFAADGLLLKNNSEAALSIDKALRIPAIFFSIQIIMNAVELPFLSRFGSRKGVNIKFIFLAAIMFIAAVYLLFGDISFLSEQGFLEAVNKLLSSENANLVAAILTVSAIVLYFLSYLISAAVFRKGAENFEQ